ncbi:MAG: hypothetical protein AAGC55_13475, partial [Myxococcota bacterium]
MAGQQQVQHDTGGVHITGDGRLAAADDLGRDVAGCSARAVEVRRCAARRPWADPRLVQRLAQPGDAEVHHFDQLAAVDLLDHDVAALEVGVDHSGLMDGLHGHEDLGHDVDDPDQVHRPIRDDQLAHSHSGHVLHGDEQQAVAAATKIDDRHRIGVVDPAGRIGLAAKAVDKRGYPGQVGIEDLDRDIAAQGDLLGAIDPAVGALADALAQGEGATQGLAEQMV